MGEDDDARRPGLIAAGGGRRAGVLVVVGATAAALPLGSQAAAGARLALLAVAAVAFAGVLVAHARRPFLSVRAVVVGSAVLVGVAVAVPPQGSADLWSYAAYGRIVAHYHRSPYRTEPDDLAPADPIGARVSPAWRATPSVYGPAFVAVAAGGSKLAGSSPTANRLFWQGLAAVAVLASLVLLARQGAGAGALAFLGLNPAVALTVVNGGHNDALVGLGVLAGVMLAERRRPVPAGAALGLAALVKVVALLPLGAVAVWTWRRGDRRGATRTLGTGAGLVLLGYALAGGRAALRPLSALAGAHSRASAWTLLGRVVPVLETPAVAVCALVVVLGAVVLGRWRPPLALLVGAVVVISLVGAPYVLPWYAASALPVLALHWRSPVAFVGTATALGLAASYIGAPRLQDALLRTLVHPLPAVAMPLFFTASLVWLTAMSRQRAWPAPAP